MKIAVDGRAAVWYEGTGMGAYARWLMKGIAATAKLAGSHFYLPDGWHDERELRDGALTAGAPTTQFWERVLAEPVIPLPEVDLYHNPHNGFGLVTTTAPCVITVHDIIPFVLPDFCGEPYGSNFRRLLPTYLATADGVIAVSHRTKDDLVQVLQVPPAHITVIHEAPEDFYRPLPLAETAHLLSRYGLHPGYVLYLGGFNARKGVKDLLESYGQLKKSLRARHPLVIVGRAEKRHEALRRRVEELRLTDDVIFTGFVPTAALPYFYNGAALFVYPSHYEGFGLPPLEAAACGTPVVTTTAASLPEVMGDGAHYVTAGERDQLAAALYALLTNEDELGEMAAKARRRSGEFSRERSFRETVALYEKLCRSSSK